jgi:hypothetical protein
VQRIQINDRPPLHVNCYNRRFLQIYLTFEQHVTMFCAIRVDKVFKLRPEHVATDPTPVCVKEECK